MTTSNIQTIVMRRVHTIHMARMVFSPVPLSLALFALSLALFGREVWVAHVLQNLSFVHSPESLLTFFVSAFVNTRFVVQVVTILMAGAVVWFVYGIQRLLAHSYRLA